MSLSSLLVQRELATIRQVEEALARQVLFGGDLATNLLEVALVDERRLTAIVAESCGIEAAEVELLLRPSARAIAAVPSALAQRCLAAPLDITPDGLVVACFEPLSEEVVAMLALAAAAPIRPRIALYVRVRELLVVAYGMPTDRRIDRLLARMGRAITTPPDPPASRLPAVETAPAPEIVDAVAPAVSRFALSDAYGRSPVVTPSAPPTEVTERVALPLENPTVILPLPDDTAPQPQVQLVPASPVTVPTSGLASPQVQLVPARTFAKPTSNPVRPSRRRRGPLTHEIAKEELDAAVDREALLDLFFEFSKQFFDYSALFVVHGDLAEGRDAFGDGASRESVVGIGVPLDLPSVLASARDARGPLFAQLGFDGVDAVLAHDLERKPGLNVLLLPALVRARTVAILYGDAGPSGVDRASAGPALAFASEVGRAFERLIVRKKLAVQTGAFPLTPSGLDRAFGSTAPRAPSEAPAFSLEQRANPVDVAAREEVLARALGLEPTGQNKPSFEADSSLALRRPSQPPPRGMTESTRPVGPPISRDEDGASAPRTEAAGGLARRSVSSAPPPSLTSYTLSPADADRLLAEIAEAEGEEARTQGRSRDVEPPAAKKVDRFEHALPSVIVDLDHDTAGWVDTVAFGDDDGGAEKALVVLGAGAMSAVMSRFPGPLNMDRALLAPPFPKASSCGNLLRLVVSLGGNAVHAIEEAARSEDRSVRFWAMFVLAELPLGSSSPVIVAGFSDRDTPVRDAARNAARACTGAAHESLLAEIGRVMRERAGSRDAKLGVLEALGDLREVLAIPMLIRAVSDNDADLANVARSSLIAVTCRDFQRDDKQWLAWWGQNSSRHRVEWLIDALIEDSPPLRSRAASELRSLTGESFGYGDHLSRRERERTQQAFRDWWGHEGRARFVMMTKTSRV